VTVSFATADGTGTAADNDYVPASGTVHFAFGETQHTVTVYVLRDTGNEPNEDFFVNFASLTSSAVMDSDDSNIKVTIVNRSGKSGD
jgi:uncharacterized protein (DUF1684 family)